MLQLLIPSTIKQLLTAMGFICLSVTLTTAAYAELPTPIQTTLIKAGLDSSNLSLVIVPVNDQTTSQHSQSAHSTEKALASQLPNSRLPAAITPSASPPTIMPDASTVSDPQLSRESIATAPSLSTVQPLNAASPLTTGLYHNANTLRTPASTMKLIPTFIALDMLGPDFVWQTKVYYSGLRMGADLFGDLIIQGSGDPKLTEERLRQLLYQVKQTGIRHIHGNIIVDSSVFRGVSKDTAAFDNDPLRPYNASPDGLLVNFSSLEIRSFPTPDGRAQLLYFPKLADYKLPDSIAQRSASCGSADISLAPQWGPDSLSFGARLPSSCGEHTFYVSYPDAKDFAARAISSLWSQLGNTVSGSVLTQTVPLSASRLSRPISPLPIASYPSRSLADTIHDINHFSNNVMTEQLTLTLPLYAHVTQPSVQSANTSLYYQQGVSDYPLALTTLDHWWRTHLTTPPPYLTNGSGLCRDCTLSAANLAELLEFAYHHPDFETYVDSLGVAGISGTIKAHGSRLPTSRAIGRAWIKTGTLNNVISMAGYVKGLSGQDYVVVAIINTPTALNVQSARYLLDTTLDWTAQH